MKKITLISLMALALLAGCSTPGSKDWCESMKKTSYSKWTVGDVKTYGADCIPGSKAVGSTDWCKDQKQKDFSTWTQNQTSDYIKNCLM